MCRYKILDSRIAGASPYTLAAKVLIDQAVTAPPILATFYTREKIYNTISKYEIYFWTSSIDEIKWKLMKIENLPQYFIGKQTLFRGKDEYKP